MQRLKDCCCYRRTSVNFLSYLNCDASCWCRDQCCCDEMTSHLVTPSDVDGGETSDKTRSCCVSTETMKQLLSSYWNWREDGLRSWQKSTMHSTFDGEADYWSWAKNFSHDRWATMQSGPRDSMNCYWHLNYLRAGWWQSEMNSWAQTLESTQGWYPCLRFLKIQQRTKKDSFYLLWLTLTNDIPASYRHVAYDVPVMNLWTAALHKNHEAIEHVNFHGNVYCCCSFFVLCCCSGRLGSSDHDPSLDILSTLNSLSTYEKNFIVRTWRLLSFAIFTCRTQSIRQVSPTARTCPSRCSNTSCRFLCWSFLSSRRTFFPSLALAAVSHVHHTSLCRKVYQAPCAPHQSSSDLASSPFCCCSSYTLRLYHGLFFLKRWSQLLMCPQRSLECRLTRIFFFLVLSLTVFASVVRAVLISVATISGWAFAGRHWAVCNSFRRGLSVAIVIWVTATTAIFGILLEQRRSTFSCDLIVDDFLYVYGKVKRLKFLLLFEMAMRAIVGISRSSG